MKQIIKKINDYVMVGLAAVLCIFMVCIVARILTKNILVENNNKLNKVDINEHKILIL